MGCYRNCNIISPDACLRQQRNHLVNKDCFSQWLMDRKRANGRVVRPGYLHSCLSNMLGAFGRTAIAQFPQNEAASDSTDLDVLVKNDWQDFSNARDCRSLMAYLDREQVVGDYCQWIRYLTYARVGDFESAGRLELLQWQSSPESPRLPVPNYFRLD